MYLVYSQLLLNGHLVKADTSLKRTRAVCPCRTSVIYFISLQDGHLSKGVWMTFKQTFVVSKLSSESYFIYTVPFLSRNSPQILVTVAFLTWIKKGFKLGELTSGSYFIYTVPRKSSLLSTKFSQDTRHCCISYFDKNL